jgi:cysteinyl-tRNA synthetase
MDLRATVTTHELHIDSSPSVRRAFFRADQRRAKRGTSVAQHRQPERSDFAFFAQDLNKAKQFAESDELRQRMQQAGVSDKPDVLFLK